MNIGLTNINGKSIKSNKILDFNPYYFYKDHVKGYSLAINC